MPRHLDVNEPAGPIYCPICGQLFSPNSTDVYDRRVRAHLLQAHGRVLPSNGRSVATTGRPLDETGVGGRA